MNCKVAWFCNDDACDIVVCEKQGGNDVSDSVS